MNITYKHDPEDNATLTAYIDNVPIAWLYETSEGWELHDGTSIHKYKTFSEAFEEFEGWY